MQTKRLWLCWLLGAAMTAALLAALALIGDFRFENSDDGLLLKAFMGFEGGVPASFELEIQPLLAWMLYALGSAMPGVAWYSLCQVGLLFFSCTVTVKSLMQLACNRLRPLLTGGVMGGLFLLLFASFAVCRISFTTTAAMAGAAAVAQLLTASEARLSSKQTLRRCLLSLLLLTLGYLLRPQSVWPSLMLLGLGFAWMLASRRIAGETLQPLWIALCCFVLVLAGLVALRQADVSLHGMQADLDWHSARAALMDYTPFESDPAPALSANPDLTAPEVNLIRQWYFLDSAITADVFSRMKAAYATVPKVAPIPHLVAFVRDTPRYLPMLCFLLALCALCCVRRTQKGSITALTALLAMLCAGAMLGYLSWQGRLLARAVDTVLLPCAAMLMSLALYQRTALAAGGGFRRVAAAALAVVMLAAAATGVRAVYHAVTRQPDTVSAQREADLESFALANPDYLIIRSPNLLRDTRLLPDVSQGIPGNITLWGDWTCRTPSWYRQLETLGFNGHTFRAKDWLRPTIVLAASEPADTDALVAYLTDALGEKIAARPLASAVS